MALLVVRLAGNAGADAAGSSAADRIRAAVGARGGIPIVGDALDDSVWGFASVADAVRAALDGGLGTAGSPDPDAGGWQAVVRVVDRAGLGTTVWPPRPPGRGASAGLDGVPAGDEPAGRLPVPTSPLVGRTAEITACIDALRDAPLVTLTGAGGCGKTRLALEVAGLTGLGYRDGAWWVELASVADPMSLPAVVGRVLGLWLDTEPDPAETLAEYLATLDALVVLDNCEHLFGACHDLVSRLVRPGGNARLLATSREPLAVDGETAIRVPPLAVADTDELVADCEAGELFVERAQSVRPNFAVTADNAGAVRQICERLDGIPLAIELAAARTRLLAPAEIAAGLGEGFALLGSSETRVDRQRTLEASVAWSYRLCSDLERVLLQRLAVFAGPFTLDAVEAVCDTPPLDRYGILDLLDRLIDRSIVAVVDRGEERRYRLLETVREFAGRELAESGEAGSVRDRHLSCYHRLAREAAEAIPRAGGLAWLDRLDDDYPNLLAALGWAAERGEIDDLLSMTAALALFWEMRGRFADGAVWLDRALTLDEQSRTEPTALRARALWGRAHLAIYAADFPTALTIAPAALAIADELGDPLASARLRNTMGFALCYSDPSAATEMLTDSIAIGAQAGDDWAIADSTKFLTVARLIAADLDACEAATDHLREVAGRLGNAFFLGWCDAAPGYCQLLHGAFGAAIASFDQSIRLARDVGDPATRGIVQAWKAYAHAKQGDYDICRAEAADCLTTTTRQGGGLGAPFARLALGVADLAEGPLDAAVSSLGELADWTRQVGDTFSSLWALPIYGQALAEAGRLDHADVVLHEAGALAGPPIANPWSAAQAIYGQALVAHARGDNTNAEGLFHQALAINHRHHFDADALACLLELGVLAADAQSWQESTRILGAVDKLASNIGLVFGQSPDRRRDQADTTARHELAEEAFTTARDEGRQLSLDEAIAYAARARGARGRPIRGWDSLTPTEERVVACVTEGLTNPAIAQRLLMSRATVKTHLAHIFTKLDVTSRAELAAAAARRSPSTP